MRNDVHSLSVYATLVVAAHAAVSAVHGFAHAALGVFLSWADNVFVAAVITVAPILAVVLLWVRRRRQGAWLLFASMAGSLLFGAYKHFVALSDDHIFHAPVGDWRVTFQVTAVLLSLIELGGCLLGARLLRAMRSAPEMA